MGNVELFELCETIPKVQCSECLLYCNQGIVYCTCGHLLKESEASRNFHHWTLSQSRTTSSEWSDLVVFGTAKPTHRKSISWPTMLEGDVSERNLKEFTIASYKTQHIVIRSSKLAGLKRDVHGEGQISKGRSFLLSIA